MLLNDRDQIIAMTAEWTGERYPNGRPRVSDEKIEILKNLTQEEIWQPLYSCGYRFQFQGDLKPLHPDKKLYGRAVTCCFMPQRPDLRQHVFNVARSRGWKGDCNQWVIDSLEESDVVVCDLYDKILRGTIDFRRGAKRGVGHESEDVLLFSPHARNRTAPLILCGEEEVEGQHAASIGRLDEAKLYYLRSRGLNDAQARRLMVDARFAPAIEKIPLEALREEVRAEAARRLDETC